MITDKFKKIIFDKLTLDLSKVDIIFYDDSLWFIDRENEYWFLELQKGGRLYWRREFFDHFFLLFTMERDEYEPLIKEWVESVLNCGVTTTVRFAIKRNFLVESVLNCGVTTTLGLNSQPLILVESVLNCGVTTTANGSIHEREQVESVLNHGVTAMVVERPSLSLEVESSLNNT